MEKVSTKEFFTVMWRDVCQALGWFFRLFATSAAILASLCAIAANGKSEIVN